MSNKKKNQKANTINILLLLIYIPYFIGVVLKLLCTPLLHSRHLLISLIKIITNAIKGLAGQVIKALKWCIHLIKNIIKTVLNKIISSFVQLRRIVTSVGKQLLNSIQIFLISMYQPALITILLTLSILTVSATTLMSIHHIEQQPYPKNVTDFRFQQPIIILDRHDVPIFTAFEKRPEKISEDSIPATLKNSVVTIEDPSFYSHHGLNFKSVFSLLSQFTNTRMYPYRTITQKLAYRSTSNENQLFGFLNELILTLRLEQKYSKEEILAMYLAIENFGTEVGANNAAEYYFNKQLSMLDQSQQLFLASLIRDELETKIAINYETNYQETLAYLKSKKVVSEDFVADHQDTPTYNPEAKLKNKANLSRYLFGELVASLQSTYDLQKGVVAHTSIDLLYQNKLEQQFIATFASASKSIPKAAVMISDPNQAAVLALTGQGVPIHELVTLKNYSDYSLSQFQNAPSSLTVFTALSTTDNREMALPVSNSAYVISQVKAAGETFSTYTDSEIISVWVGNQNSENDISQNVIESKNTLDQISNYLLKSKESSNK